MITLNPFVENNKARINQFLNNLCEVGDFYETLEVSLLSPTAQYRFDEYSRWTNIWHCPKRIS